MSTDDDEAVGRAQMHLVRLLFVRAIVTVFGAADTAAAPRTEAEAQAELDRERARNVELKGGLLDCVGPGRTTEH